MPMPPPEAAEFLARYAMPTLRAPRCDAPCFAPDFSCRGLFPDFLIAFHISSRTSRRATFSFDIQRRRLMMMPPRRTMQRAVLFSCQRAGRRRRRRCALQSQKHVAAWQVNGDFSTLSVRHRALPLASCASKTMPEGWLAERGMSSLLISSA